MKPGRICVDCGAITHYPLAHDAACAWCGGGLGDDYETHKRWESWLNTWWALGRLVAFGKKPARAGDAA